MWSLMMTAMMLPAVAPVASLYVRTIASDRPQRLVLFVGGYLVVVGCSRRPRVSRTPDHRQPRWRGVDRHAHDRRRRSRRWPASTN